MTQAGSQSETTILLRVVRERYSLQGYQECSKRLEQLPGHWASGAPGQRPGQCCRRGAAARQVAYQPGHLQQCRCPYILMSCMRYPDIACHIGPDVRCDVRDVPDIASGKKGVILNIGCDIGEKTPISGQKLRYREWQERVLAQKSCDVGPDIGSDIGVFAVISEFFSRYRS